MVLYHSLPLFAFLFLILLHPPSFHCPLTLSSPSLLPLSSHPLLTLPSPHSPLSSLSPLLTLPSPHPPLSSSSPPFLYSFHTFPIPSSLTPHPPHFIPNTHLSSPYPLQVGKGLLRVLKCQENNIADFIPVDYVNNMLVSVGWVTALQKPAQPIVYNCTTSNLNPISWIRMCEWGGWALFGVWKVWLFCNRSCFSLAYVGDMYVVLSTFTRGHWLVL